MLHSVNNDHKTILCYAAKQTHCLYIEDILFNIFMYLKTFLFKGDASFLTYWLRENLEKWKMHPKQELVLQEVKMQLK